MYINMFSYSRPQITAITESETVNEGHFSHRIGSSGHSAWGHCIQIGCGTYKPREEEEQVPVERAIMGTMSIIGSLSTSRDTRRAPSEGYVKLDYKGGQGTTK